MRTTSLLAVLLFIYLTYTLGALAATCTRDTYITLPSGPQFPTKTLSSSFVPSGRPLTTGHWSEVAQYAKYRPAKITPSANPPKDNCPHLATGLVDWHDAATWAPGPVPTNNTAVTIPANKRVLVSSCSIASSLVFQTITIPAGSALILGDAEINIAATGFQVNGELLVGSSTCRLRSKISITLHGKRPSSASLPAVSSVKGIAVVNGGRADIHGTRYFPTWSRLAMTAAANDSYVFIQDMVNWVVGQQIFITSTELKDARDWHRNEVRTIVDVYKTSLHSTVAAIKLDRPLDYTHFGGREYQAEVGLLSRNILIQGDPFNSAPTDTANAICYDNSTSPSNTRSTYPCPNKYLSGFGGHVQVMGAGSTGRFSGVELVRMGQTNVLGRYPLHWHMIGQTNETNNYATDCSVHESYFRCYTIHGTHGVRLAENTAYNAIGNCFYLSENGVEENSTIQYNLAAHVHIIGNMQDPSVLNLFWGQNLLYYNNSDSYSLLVPADMSAAPFYMTNMYNTIEGNAASGGWTGFSFPSLPAPIDDFKSITNFNPANRPFRTPFRGNTAHSSGFWWGSAAAFYFGGEMTYTDSSKTILKYTEGRSSIVHDTCSDTTAGTPGGTGGCWDLPLQMWLQIQDNKAFLTNRGLQSWGNRADIVRLEIHDAVLSMNVFGKVWIDDMLMQCRTRNHRPAWFAGCPAAPAQVPWPAWGGCNVRDYYFWQRLGGFQWYDVGQSHIVQNSVFRNCRPDWSGCIYGSKQGQCDGTTAFTSLSHSDQFVPQLMQTTSGITYDNSTDHWRTSTNLTVRNTVSGRMQSWLDADGTASGTKQRTMIGSAFANEWWKMHDSTQKCKLEAERWVCVMDQKDASAAINLHYNSAMEAQIGGNICANGEAKPCPVVAKASHFGRRNESRGVDVAVMGQLTGPLMYQSGGWFIRYIDGMPRTLKIGDIQVFPADKLVLAFPYPAGTKFSIYFQAASWCQTSWATCTHPFTNVTSVEAVANGNGDLYFWDNVSQVLYVRATMQTATWPKPDAPWTSIPPPNTFSRGGLTLPLIASGPQLVITATCSSDPCAPQNQVMVPNAMRPNYVDSRGGLSDSAASGVQPMLASLAKALSN